MRLEETNLSGKVAEKRKHDLKEPYIKVEKGN